MLPHEAMWATAWWQFLNGRLAVSRPLWGLMTTLAGCGSGIGEHFAVGFLRTSDGRNELQHRKKYVHGRSLDAVLGGRVECHETAVTRSGCCAG